MAFWLIPLLVAVLSFGIQFLFSDNLVRLQSFDAAHYICSAKGIFDSHDKLLAAHLLRLDGPLMPLLALLATFLGNSAVGVVPQSTSELLPYLLPVAGFWMLTAAIVALASRFITKSVLAGLWAGLAFVFYLPAQAAVLSFLTETPTATLALLFATAPSFCLALFRLKRTRAAYLVSFAIGLIGAALAMTKTALLPSAAAVILVFLLLAPASRRITSVVAMAMGALLVVATYASAMHSLSGRFELLPSRDPAMNMAVGCDIEVGGWECKPMTFEVQTGSFQKPLITLTEFMTREPAAFAGLTFSKFVRSWNTAWVLMRRPILGLPDWVPQLQHAIFISAGIVSVWGYSSRIKLCKFMSSRTLACMSLIFMILGHNIFVLFEAQPRYMFSALPMIVVLSLGWFFSLKKMKSRLIAAGLCFLGASFIFASRAPYNEAVSGIGFKQTLPQLEDNGKYYFIFSGREVGDNEPFNISLNGRSLSNTAKPKLLLEFMNFPYPKIVQDMNRQAEAARDAQIWKWYYLPLTELTAGDRNFGRAGGPQQLEVKGSGPFLAQYAELSAEHVAKIPALFYSSLSCLESSADGLELRPPMHVKLKAIHGSAGVGAAGRNIPVAFVAEKIVSTSGEKWILYEPQSSEILH